MKNISAKTLVNQKNIFYIFCESWLVKLVPDLEFVIGWANFQERYFLWTLIKSSLSFVPGFELISGQKDSPLHLFIFILLFPLKMGSFKTLFSFKLTWKSSKKVILKGLFYFINHLWVKVVFAKHFPRIGKRILPPFRKKIQISKFSLKSSLVDICEWLFANQSYIQSNLCTTTTLGTQK